MGRKRSPSSRSPPRQKLNRLAKEPKNKKSKNSVTKLDLAADGQNKPILTEELVRCNDWICSQKKEKRKWDEIADDLVSIASEDPIDVSANLSESTTTEKQPSRNKIKYKVSLACEWKHCVIKCNTFSEFQVHVDTHLEDVAASACELSDLECHWDLCNFIGKTNKELRMHIYYHIYHTNLKTLGEQQLLQKKPLPPCIRDSRRRNCVPEIRGDYLCQWLDCTFKFERIYDLFAHSRLHREFESSLRRKYESPTARMIKCQWISCNKLFEKSWRFMDHLRVHTTERILACPNCGSTFASHNKFNAHFNRQSQTSKSIYQYN